MQGLFVPQITAFDKNENHLENGVGVLLGSDILLVKGIAAGASGGICELANFFPQQITRPIMIKTLRK